MFFQGSLQEGIAAAVQQQKRVICFVHDDAEQSTAWESDYLLPLAAPINDNAVALKIAAGSQEAGFLSAICPVDEAPAVVVISNGQVKEALRPPMEVDQFRRQLLSAMDLNFKISQPAGQPSSTTTADTPQDSAPASVPASSQPTGAPQTGAGSSAEEAPAVTTTTTTAEPAWMAERRRRMADLEAQRARERQQKQEAARRAAQVPGSRAAELAKNNEEMRKKRKQAADERQRVLDNIEADKRERRKAAEARAEERARERELGGQSEQSEQSGQGSNTRITSKPAPETVLPSKSRLQLRFSDGRVEKSEFSAKDTLLTVRQWIASNGGAPEGKSYAFRHVVGTGTAPQFSPTEEQETLLGLGLAPSATLIIRATPSAVNAVSRGSFGVLTQIWALLLLLLSPLTALVNYLTRGSAPSEAAPRATMDHDAVGRSTATDAKAADLSSLEERKKRGKPNLYNGNQTSVLPNDQAEDEDEDS